MVLWTGLLIVNPPAQTSAITLGFQKYLLAFDVALIGGRFLSLYIGGFMGEPICAIIAYSFVGVVFNLVLIASVFFVLSKRRVI